MMNKALLLGLSFWAGALAAVSAAAAPSSSWLPKDECKKVWKTGDGQYRAGESYADYVSRARRTECRKNWTVLVYMAADNNLSPYAGWDLYEMEAAFGEVAPRAASTAITDLVVQLDASGNGGVKRFHMFEGKEPYRMRKLADFAPGFEAKVASPVAMTLPELDSADPANFEEFLAWGMKSYPADHYLVILWGHGEGWTPAPRKHGAAPTSPAGGVAFDDTSKTVMNIPALSAVLKNVSTRVLEGRPIDVYAADACLMQMVEVTTEFADSVRFAVGSTQIQSLLGLPYRRLLWEINKNSYLSLKKTAPPTADDAYLLAQMIPSLFRKSLDRTRGLQGRIDGDSAKSFTSSAVSLADLRRLALPALKNFGEAMDEWLREKPLRALAVQGIVQSGDFISYEGGARDLSAFLMLVKMAVDQDVEMDASAQATPAATRLKAAIDVARDSLRESVIASSFGSEYTTADDKFYLLGYRVLSTWVPTNPQQFSERVGDFRTSRFYKATNWGAWLGRVFK